MKHIQDQAEEAQAAAKANDTSKLFSITKQLPSKTANKMSGIRLKHHSMASSPLATRQRWQQFLAEKRRSHHENHRHASEHVRKTEGAVRHQTLGRDPNSVSPCHRATQRDHLASQTLESARRRRDPCGIVRCRGGHVGSEAPPAVVKNDVQSPGATELEGRNAHGTAQSNRPKRLQCASQYRGKRTLVGKCCIVSDYEKYSMQGKKHLGTYFCAHTPITHK